MSTTLTPLKWAEPLNPADEVDYTFDLVGNLLETGEGVTTWSLTLSVTSIAAGLKLGSGQYATVLGKIVNGVFTIDSTGAVLKIWFSVDSTHVNDTTFDSIGTWLDMTVAVVTNNTPPRIRDRTLLLRVCRQ